MTWKCGRRHLRESKFKDFPGEHAPGPPRSGPTGTIVWTWTLSQPGYAPARGPTWVFVHLNYLTKSTDFTKFVNPNSPCDESIWYSFKHLLEILKIWSLTWKIHAMVCSFVVLSRLIGWSILLWKFVCQIPSS